jgi:hypothetical protein
VGRHCQSILHFRRSGYGTVEDSVWLAAEVFHLNDKQKRLMNVMKLQTFNKGT